MKADRTDRQLDKNGQAVSVSTLYFSFPTPQLVCTEYICWWPYMYHSTTICTTKKWQTPLIARICHNFNFEIFSLFSCLYMFYCYFIFFFFLMGSTNMGIYKIGSCDSRRYGLQILLSSGAARNRRKKERFWGKNFMFLSLIWSWKISKNIIELFLEAI